MLEISTVLSWEPNPLSVSKDAPVGYSPARSLLVLSSRDGPLQKRERKQRCESFLPLLPITCPLLQAQVWPLLNSRPSLDETSARSGCRQHTSLTTFSSLRSLAVREAHCPCRVLALLFIINACRLAI